MFGLKIEAIATDIDGTLTDRKMKISCAAIKAARKAEDHGVPVLLVSGNSLPVLKTLKSYIGCSGALVAEGGAVIEYQNELRILKSNEKPLKALAVLKEKVGQRLQETWSNKYRYADVAFKRTISKKTILDVLIGFPGLKLVDSGFAYHIQDGNYDKGDGLIIAAELMKIPIENIAAIGDSATDIELLKIAGYGITVANAPSEVRSIAKYITKNRDGEGFNEAVNLILKHTL